MLCLGTAVVWQIEGFNHRLNESHCAEAEAPTRESSPHIARVETIKVLLVRQYDRISRVLKIVIG